MIVETETIHRLGAFTTSAGNAAGPTAGQQRRLRRVARSAGCAVQAPRIVSARLAKAHAGKAIPVSIALPGATIACPRNRSGCDDDEGARRAAPTHRRVNPLRITSTATFGIS